MTINSDQLGQAWMNISFAAAAAQAPPAQVFSPVWFDIMAAVLLVVGLLLGKKRGMSQELLDVLQWIVIVAAGAQLYLPLAQLIGPTIGIGALATNIICYLFVAVVVKFIFILIKRATGEKLVGSDLFGSMEYYLGMLAGMIRLFCMTLFAMSLMNAEVINNTKIEAIKAAQTKELGSTFFPTWDEIRQTALQRSIIGNFARQKLPFLLMQPVDGGPGGPIDREGSLGRRKEKALDDALGTGKK